MKRIIALSLSLLLFGAYASAQSNDSIERLRQQEALLKQQQKEQQELMRQQQAEQEELQKQQRKEEEQALKERQKEEARIAKEQLKEAEAAAKAEQKRAEAEAKAEAKAEQKRVEAEAKAEQKKADAARKKEERKARKAAIGRDTRFTLDPFASYALGTRCLRYSDVYHGSNGAVGLDIVIHNPIAKRWDFDFGLGYRYTNFWYSNRISYDTVNKDFVWNDTKLSHYSYSVSTYMHTLEIPLRLSHIDKDGDAFYFGLNLGYNLSNRFMLKQLEPDNTYTTIQDFDNTKNYLKYRCDVVMGFGGRSKMKLFSPGLSFYFNLVPTYIKGTNGDEPIHEFGIRVNL